MLILIKLFSEQFVVDVHVLAHNSFQSLLAVAVLHQFVSYCGRP